MDSISKLIECKWCLVQLSDPVNLPCGYTVCRKHSDELQKLEWKCCLCEGVHKLAKGESFPVSDFAISLLKSNIPKLNFGPKYKETKIELNAVETKFRELKHAISQPGEYISSLTSKFRIQVDLRREEMIKVIDDVCQDMNKAIDEFEAKAEESIKTRAKEMRELAENVEPKMNEWKQNLDELEVKVDQWEEIASEAKSLKRKLDSQLIEPLNLPSDLSHFSMSVERNAFVQLSKRLKTQEIDEKSLLVLDLSKIAKAQNWNDIESEVFPIKGFSFKLNVQFDSINGKLHMSPFLSCESNLEEESVSLTWTIKVLGKPFHKEIYEEELDHEFKGDRGWATTDLISLTDIMAHPAYDAQQDMVRVVFIYLEGSLVSKPRHPVRKSVSVPNLSKIAKARSWKTVSSETIIFQDFELCLRVKFQLFDGQMYLGAFLYCQSNPTWCPLEIKLTWMLKIVGKNDEIIMRHNFEHRFERNSELGSNKVLSIKEIMNHETVRVEVLLFEDNFESSFG